jgi:hypothetical protein
MALDGRAGGEVLGASHGIGQGERPQRNANYRIDPAALEGGA